MAASLLRRAMAQANLLAAWLGGLANQGGAGVDGVTVSAFMLNAPATLRQLAARVLDDTYTATALRECLIEKPADDSAANNAAPATRSLAIPTVADRLLQTAVALVLTPILEREFEECSYAYRSGRGVQQAVRRIERLREEGYLWVVDADITAFFDRIPHQPLLRTLQALAPDAKLLALIAQWLCAPILTVDGLLTPRALGLPQGSPLSPLLSNLYLDTLDEAMLDADHRIVRFADDFVILCRSQAQAQDALALTQEVLTSLSLSLNNDKTRITDFAQGFRFLGVTFVRSLALTAAPVRKAKSGKHAEIQIAPLAPLAPIVPIVPIVPTLPPLPRGALMLAADTITATPQRTPVIKKPAPAYVNPMSKYSENALQAALREANAFSIISAATTHEAPMPSKANSEPIQTVAINADTHAITPPPTWISENAEDINDSTNEADLNLTDDDAAQNPHNLRAMPLLRTLYLLEQGAEVSREGDSLKVSLDEIMQTEIGLPQLDLVCTMGNISFSTPALQACMRAEIPVVFMSRTGKLYGQTVGAQTQQAAILRAQVMASMDEPARLIYARQFIRAKLLNSRVLIARLARRRHTNTNISALLQATAIALRDAAWQAESAQTLAQLNGIEGASAVRYFAALRAILPAQWQFGNRQASPAPDPVNAMLSFGYSLLRSNIVALLNGQGLNPQIGFLHADGLGHSALASDIMEEFRALTVDAMVLELISRGRLTPDDFTLPTIDHAGEPCRLSPDAIRLFIHEFEARMQAAISVRNAGGNRDPSSLRFMILAQIQSLSQAMRGHHQYHPFLGK